MVPSQIFPRLVKSHLDGSRFVFQAFVNDCMQYGAVVIVAETWKTLRRFFRLNVHSFNGIQELHGVCPLRNRSHPKKDNSTGGADIPTGAGEIREDEVHASALTTQTCSGCPCIRFFGWGHLVWTGTRCGHYAVLLCMLQALDFVFLWIRHVSSHFFKRKNRFLQPMLNTLTSYLLHFT